MLCPSCQKEKIISSVIGVCGECLRKNPEQFLPSILSQHQRLRESLGLPPSPPRAEKGKKCNWCQNQCQIPEGGVGFCGARKNQKGKLIGGTRYASLSYYFDPLPTNCVADWVCPAGSDAGYPEFSYSQGAEYGYYNLAVFYHACTFHCLNCQNWHFRKMEPDAQSISFGELAEKVNQKTACICYFGGDPTPYLVHSLLTGKEARRRNPGKILRICWESNGAMNQGFLKPMLKLAEESGGIIKFDLKAFSEPIHLALTGTSNRQSLSNFSWLAKNSREISRKRGYPVLVASTLLVPGMIDEKEVYQLAKFIAQLDPEIPYALLAFHPDCYLTDLPRTSRAQAEACWESAQKAGLKNLRIGNLHLLW